MQARENSSASTLSWILNKVVALIKYPLSHPIETCIYLFGLNGARLLMKALSEPTDFVIKYPVDSIQMSYAGSSVLYIPDERFDPKIDLSGCVTDRHAMGYYDFDENPAYRFVTTSFNTDGFPKKDQDGLFYVRYRFYELCYLKSNVDGYANLLSHRSVQSPSLQSTFGFYGQSKIEKLFNNHYPEVGYIIGIRAFGKTGFYSTTHNGTKYQLAKINMNSIDFSLIAETGQYNSMSGIAHVYVKDGVVMQHPDTQALKAEFCQKGWSIECYENYIQNLPNFSSAVDWVINAKDLAHVLKGKPVLNLLNNEQINILKWQRKQHAMSRLNLEKYGIFALPRPSDYSRSYEYDENTKSQTLKPPLRFMIGTGQ